MKLTYENEAEALQVGDQAETTLKPYTYLTSACTDHPLVPTSRPCAHPPQLTDSLITKEAFQEYSDFDDHLAKPELDWLNQAWARRHLAGKQE